MKKQTANVGLFCDCFPPVMDGVSVCMQNYAYWMQKMVGGVEVITPSVSGADYSQYDFKVLDYISMPVPMRKPYVTGIAQLDPSFLKNILNTRYKIVHAHCPFATGFAAYRIATKQNIPMVATFHSKYRDDFARVIKSEYIVDTIIKEIIGFYEKADEVWVPQDSVKEVIREYGFKGHVEVVDNGCDLVKDYPEKFFTESRKSLGIAPEEFVLLFVGQHIWEKNVRFIIDAVSEIRDVPFRMIFVGDGYAASEMRELVSRNGMDNKITFAGSIKDRETITQYYAAADLFLFPSLYDNAPLVVREAAALHTPAVMVKGATAATILKDGENGFLINNNLQDFTSTLRDLIADPERVHRVGVQASHSIVRSWEDVVGEVLDRYNALIRRHSEITKI